MNDRLTLRERWENIKADWLGTPKEVRMTAVGWKPAGYWREECGEQSASGEDEYYRIVRVLPKWKRK